MPLVFSEPRLSRGAAHILSAIIAVSYVACLYLAQLSQTNSRARYTSRDDPRVIKVRLLAVSLTTIASCAIVLWAVWVLVPEDVEPAFTVALSSTYARLGLPFSLDSASRFPSLKPHLITPLLFLGPLYAHSLSGSLPFQKNFSFKSHVLDVILTWQGFRNYIMGPLTEELTYRSCILSLLHLAGFSKRAMVFFAPCWFGVAHIHHAYDTYNKFGRTSTALRRALLGSSFQFAYTTIFGWLCSFLFLRTGSLAVPLLAHIFCNVMGVPQLGAELAEHPAQRTSIWAAYIFGVMLFSLTLDLWTRTPDSLYWPVGPQAVARY